MSTKVSLQKQPSNPARAEQPFIQVQLKQQHPAEPKVSTRYTLDDLEQHFNYYEHILRVQGLVNIDDLVYPPESFDLFINEHRNKPFPTTN